MQYPPIGGRLAGRLSALTKGDRAAEDHLPLLYQYVRMRLVETEIGGFCPPSAEAQSDPAQTPLQLPPPPPMVNATCLTTPPEMTLTTPATGEVAARRR